MQNLVHLGACKIRSHVQDAYSNNTRCWPSRNYFEPNILANCISYNIHKYFETITIIYNTILSIVSWTFSFLKLCKRLQLLTISILDVKEQDECENCKEIMTLIDTILSNQQIEDYVSRLWIYRSIFCISFCNSSNIFVRNFNIHYFCF